MRNVLLFLGLALFSSAAEASKPVPGFDSPSLDCVSILRLVSQIGKLAEQLPGAPTIAPTRGAEGIPEWAKPLLALQQRAQPHLDFVAFADSRVLSLITAIQLRELGVSSAERAATFLRAFPNLPPDRQIAFINGLVFRLFWESLNGLPPELNQQRLGLTAEDFTSFHRFLRQMAAPDYPNFALSLMCHFDFRSDPLANRVVQAWEETLAYIAPVELPLRREMKMHGVSLAPENGARLYTEKDLGRLLAHLLKIRAPEAIGFFLETEIPRLTLVELRALPTRNLPETLRAKVEVWVKRQTALLALSDTERSRQILIHETQNELRMVETRIRLHGWVNELRGIGDATRLVDTLRLNVDQCVGAMQNQGCSWIQTGLRIVLDYVGMNPGGWSGFLVSSLLSRLLADSVASSAGYTDQLSNLLEEMHQRSLPVAAFAQGALTQGGTPQDLEALRERKRALEARLTELQSR